MGEEKHVALSGYTPMNRSVPPMQTIPMAVLNKAPHTQMLCFVQPKMFSSKKGLIKNIASLQLDGVKETSSVSRTGGVKDERTSIKDVKI